MSSINDNPRLVLADADMATRRTSKANGRGKTQGYVRHRSAWYDASLRPWLSGGVAGDRRPGGRPGVWGVLVGLTLAECLTIRM